MKIISKSCIVCNGLVEYIHKSKPKECPFCKDKYWDKPKDERDLFILQDAYISNGRKKEDLGKMYEKLLTYSENIIKHKLKNKKILSKESFYDKASNIALIMIERYLSHPTEKIEFSFGGMMLRIANGVLYGSKKEDQALSLNQEIFKNKEMIDSMDNVDHLNSQARYFTMEDPTNKEIHSYYNLKSNINDIIEKIYKRVYVKKSSQNLLFLVGLNHFFSRKRDIFTRDFNQIIFNSTKRNIEQVKLLIRNYLLDKEIFNE